MSEEKCFCHFNGYAVKDSTARADIENIKNKLVGKGVIYDLAEMTFTIESSIKPFAGQRIDYYDTGNHFTELNVGDYLVLKVSCGTTYSPLVKVENISENVYTFKVIGDLTEARNPVLYRHCIRLQSTTALSYCHVEVLSFDSTPFTAESLFNYLVPFEDSSTSYPARGKTSGNVEIHGIINHSVIESGDKKHYYFTAIANGSVAVEQVNVIQFKDTVLEVQ